MRHRASAVWSLGGLTRSARHEDQPRPISGHNSFWARLGFGRGERMYAITFDLDLDALKKNYPGNTPTQGYEDIGRVLGKYGFSRQQGSVYFGDKSVTPVVCVMAVQDVQKTHPWFVKVVGDIRMLRIEEHNDLMPAIAQQELQLGGGGQAAE